MTGIESQQSPLPSSELDNPLVSKPKAVHQIGMLSVLSALWGGRSAPRPYSPGQVTRADKPLANINRERRNPGHPNRSKKRRRK